MKRTWTATWLLSGLLALTGTAWAQTAPPAGEEGTTKTTTTTTTTTTTGTGHHKTVTKEQVKTWTADIDGTEYEVHPQTLSYDYGTGLFHMATAYTLPKGKWAFQVFRDNLDRDPKDIDFSNHGASLAFGATSRLELFAGFGIQHRVDADALFQNGIYNDLPFVRTPWETGFGDIRAGLKYKFLDDYHGDPVALALQGWVKIPTADEDKGLGTGKADFGANLLISKNLGDFADLHGIIGYEKKGDPTVPSGLIGTGGLPSGGADLDIADEFKYGIGINIPACSWIQVQADLLHHQYTGKDFVDSVTPGGQTNPTDLVVGPVVWIKPGFYIRPAISWNLSFDDRGLNQSSKSWTGRQLSIGYHPGTACHAIFVPPPPPPPPPANRNPTVVCEIERSLLTPPDMTVRVRATASDPDGDPLTYTWSASSGRITGTGAEATLDATGVTGPTTITVTVNVSDGRGGTATSTCSVRVGEMKKAEVTTCTSGGFPRNLSRLNNVDKACLDDVASRLKQDPRSRVIVVGHADTTEKNPDVIAMQRANAVKDYLVKERGVDESRITVRSAAATKPVDTGTTVAARARNRRVEVIFVPEGATAPEMDE
jgi:outer membrane protein OmpA-like peptidoglycan-associated protein